MKVSKLIEHNFESYFRCGATLDLTFGDLYVLFIGKNVFFIYYFSNFYLNVLNIDIKFSVSF